MKIEIIRNATLILHFDDKAILVDPMLANEGALPSFSIFRHKAKRNPTVPLPLNTKRRLANVTHALITHCKRGHADHLDTAGKRYLRERALPTYCRAEDASYLRKRDIAAIPLAIGKRQPFLGGFVTPIPAKHGHGWISSLMGRGVGYLLEPAGHPSVYIAGDTVMTDDVRHVLTHLAPEIAIVAAGNASVDIGQPILMSLDEVMEFALLAPGIVVANHLEALNHCPVTRQQVADAARKVGLQQKIHIPADGDILDFRKLSKNQET